jgi:hypothetical protein
MDGPVAVLNERRGGIGNAGHPGAAFGQSINQTVTRRRDASRLSDVALQFAAGKASDINKRRKFGTVIAR